MQEISARITKTFFLVLGGKSAVVYSLISICIRAIAKSTNSGTGDVDRDGNESSDKKELRENSNTSVDVIVTSKGFGDCAKCKI